VLEDDNSRDTNRAAQEIQVKDTDGEQRLRGRPQADVAKDDEGATRKAQQARGDRRWRHDTEPWRFDN